MASIALSSGATVGAKADWSSSVPMALNAGGITFQASDASDVAHDISFGDVLSGTGSLTKKGGGALTLTGTNTYTGNTTVSAGTLNVNGSLAAASTVAVNAATLGGQRNREWKRHRRRGHRQWLGAENQRLRNLHGQ